MSSVTEEEPDDHVAVSRAEESCFESSNNSIISLVTSSVSPIVHEEDTKVRPVAEPVNLVGTRYSEHN